MAWVAVATILAIGCFTEFFIPSSSSAADRTRGLGYFTYITLFFGLIIFVLYRTFRNLAKLVGGRRIELQVWLVGGCAMTLSILATMVLNALTKNHLYIQAQPLLVLAFYAGTAYAITTYRIFDAQHFIQGSPAWTCFPVLAGWGGGGGLLHLPAPLPDPFAGHGFASYDHDRPGPDPRFSLKNCCSIAALSFIPATARPARPAYTVAHNETRGRATWKWPFLTSSAGRGRGDQGPDRHRGRRQEPAARTRTPTEDEQVANAPLHNWATLERLGAESTDRGCC